jgi:GntR family transcriptional regulator
MVIVIDPMSRQLADLLAEQIKAGTLPADRPLPSETALRQEYGVSRGTVRAAIAELRERGLVVTIPQRGTYVVKK